MNLKPLFDALDTFSYFQISFFFLTIILICLRFKYNLKKLDIEIEQRKKSLDKINQENELLKSINNDKLFNK